MQGEVKRMKYWIALAVGMLAGVCAGAQTKPTAQMEPPVTQTTIYIGTELQLGIPRDTVIARLGTNYKVVKIEGAGDDWIVEEKNDPSNIVGSVGFTNGKLTYAAKDWTQGDEDNYALAQALRGAMAQMGTEGQHSCFFETPSSRSPVAEMTYLRFYCGPKRIDITTTDVLNGTDKGRYVSITEVLSSEKNR